VSALGAAGADGEGRADAVRLASTVGPGPSSAEQPARLITVATEAAAIRQTPVLTGQMVLGADVCGDSRSGAVDSAQVRDFVDGR